MYLVYRPEGSDEQRWVFLPGKLRTIDTEAIERKTGWDYTTEFLAHLQKGNTLARRALVWVYLRRDHARMKFEDIDIAADEVELMYDRDELAQIREQIETQPFESETLRAQALQAIDADMANAPEAPGKALASDADSST